MQVARCAGRTLPHLHGDGRLHGDGQSLSEWRDFAQKAVVHALTHLSISQEQKQMLPNKHGRGFFEFHVTCAILKRNECVSVNTGMEAYK